MLAITSLIFGTSLRSKPASLLHDKWVSIWADDKASHSSFFVFLLVFSSQNSFRGMTDLLGHGYIIMAANRQGKDGQHTRRPHSSEEIFLIYLSAVKVACNRFPVTCTFFAEYASDGIFMNFTDQFIWKVIDLPVYTTKKWNQLKKNWICNREFHVIIQWILQNAHY